MQTLLEYVELILPLVGGGGFTRIFSFVGELRSLFWARFARPG
jgi:hypothetical protein